MSDNIEKKNAELERLGRLERLVMRYAASRSLGLLLFVALVVIGTVASIALMRLLFWKPTWWLVCIVIMLMVGTSIGGLWLMVKVFPRCERRLYRKEGQIELGQEKVAIWVCVAYVVTFLGPILLNAVGIMPVRWALTLALASFGIFILYASGKEKNRPLGATFCAVLLAEAGVTAVGVPSPFCSKGWLYSCFAALMIYIAGAGLITAVAVHIYNRWILRKIKGMRPCGEQEADKSDSQ